MIFLLPSLSIVVISLLMELGRWFGVRWRRRNSETSTSVGAVEGAVLGLMGLLIAFTFYGAETRFDNRRNLIIEEANAIDTAYLRLDTLSTDTQPKLREDFREYVRSRLVTYQKIPDWEVVGPLTEEMRQSAALQREIWKDAVAATNQADRPPDTLVLPAINRMIELATTRTVALEIHPPIALWVMLALTVIASCVLAGYSMSSGGTRHWVHIVAFSLLFSAYVFVIVDFEYPRMRGFIRIQEMDRLLVRTLENMK